MSNIGGELLEDIVRYRLMMGRAQQLGKHTNTTNRVWAVENLSVEVSDKYKSGNVKMRINICGK